MTQEASLEACLPAGFTAWSSRNPRGHSGFGVAASQFISVIAHLPS
jgi:hypothetical protein